MILDTINKVIKLITSSSADIHVVAAWADLTTSGLAGGSSALAPIAGIGTNTIIAAPAASTVRQIKNMLISNRHAATANTITIVYFDGTNSLNVFVITLVAGAALEYDGFRFIPYDANGNPVTGPAAITAGSDKTVLFNDAGTVAGDADFIWDKVNNKLKLPGTNTGLQLQQITAEPSAPAAGLLEVYSKTVAGKTLARMKGPGGFAQFLQESWVGGPAIYIWTNTGSTNGLWLNTVGAGAGTFASVMPQVTNLYTAMRRGTWANVITTLNQVLGQRNTEGLFYRGNTGNQGGFLFYARFGLDVFTAGSRFFIGIHPATTVVSANPSASLNIAGFGIDDTDSAFTFMHNDGSGTATKDTIAGQPTVASNQGYECYIYCKPNDNTIYWRLEDAILGTLIAEGSVTTDLPASTTTLTVGALASNAALTAATATKIGLATMYVSTER